MSHLDYCSANYLRVVGHKTGNDFFVAHPATMQFRQEILRSRSSLCPVPAPSSGLLPGSSLKGASQSFSLRKIEERVAGEKEILQPQLNVQREESCSNELLSLKKNLSHL